MKYAADFRSIARNALSGRWTIAVIAGLIASLLGAVASNGPEVNFTYNDNGANVNLELFGRRSFPPILAGMSKSWDLSSVVPSLSSSLPW